MSLLDDLIAAEREHPAEPSPVEAKATWKRVQRSLAVGLVPPFDLSPPVTAVSKLVVAKGTTGLLSSAVTKVVLTATLVGGGTASWVVSREAPPPRVAEGLLADRAEEAATPRPAAGPTISAPPALSPSAPALDLSALPHAPLPPAPRSTPVDRRPALERATPRHRAVTTTAPASPPPASNELTLIRRAQHALRSGQPDLAMQWVAEHRTLHERGAMVEDREAIEILALCQLERTQEAVAARNRFMSRWPRSVYERRLRRACR